MALTRENSPSPSESHTISVSIILPTYKEKHTIHPLLDEIDRYLSPAEENYEIIVVDDSSPDGTPEIVREAARENPRIRLIERTERGLAEAIRVGIEASEGEIIVIMDTDFNHPPEMIPQLLTRLSQADLVIGSRYTPGGGMERGWLRFQLSRLYNIMIKFLLRLPTGDNLSGFLCFKKSLYKSLPKNRIFIGYGDYCIRLVQAVHRAGQKIIEIPVVYGERRAGQSKTRFLFHFTAYTLTLLSIFFRPVRKKHQ